MRRAFHILIALSLLIGLSTHAAAIEPAELKELLEKRDKAFDNAALRFNVHQTFYESRNESQGDDATGMGPWLNPNHVRTITVRGEDITIDALENTSPGSDSRLSKRAVQSTVGPANRLILFSVEWQDRPYAIHMQIIPDGPYADGWWRPLAEAKMAFGYSLGYPLISIDSIIEAGDGLQSVVGIVRIDELECPVTFEIDKDLLIRHAVIKVPRRPEPYTLEIHSSGTAVTGASPFAQRGTFRRLDGSDADPSIRATQCEFKEFLPHLSETAYAERTTIQIPDGANVSDRVSRTRYKKGDEVHATPDP